MIDSLNLGLMTGGSWVGNGVQLDGTDDLVTLNRLRQITGDWTVMFIARPDDISGVKPWIDQGNILVKQSGANIIYGATDTFYTDYTGTLSAALAAGKPINVAVKRSGTTVTIYTNGAKQSSFAVSGTPLTALPSLIIGAAARASFVFPALPTLTTQNGLVINACDIVEYDKGSGSLNSVTVTENWNSEQWTARIRTSLSFVPGDGLTHQFLDNQGTSATNNRVQIYIDTAGLLTFVVHDTDSTQHLVTYDVSGWTAGVEHQIVAVIDFKNNAMLLYTDGTVRDNTPTAALSSDSIDAIGATTHIGSNASDANQLNGSMTIQLFNRAWASTDVDADDPGVDFVVDPYTNLMANYTNSVTTISYHPSGKSVSAIVANANDATLTTAAGVDTAIFDGEQVIVEDATGFSKPAFADGDAASSTEILVDDGAGGAVADIEKVGVSVDFAGTHGANGGNIHNVAANDFSISVVIRTTATGSRVILDKGYPTDAGVNRYVLYVVNGSLTLGIGLSDFAAFTSDSSDYNDGRYHHVAVTADRDGNVIFYKDGVADGTDDISGKAGDLTDTGDFNIGVKSPSESGLLNFNGDIVDVKILTNGLWSPAQILYQATHPKDVSASAGTITDNWLLDEGTGTTLNGKVNNLTLSNAAAWTLKAHLTRNLLIDIEHGGIGGLTIVGTPTLVDKESDTDSDSLSLHVVAAADNDGVSQTIAASNGDKFYLSQRHRVSNGSFEVNVINGGGGIETGIADAAWTELELIIAATGTLTFQWLGEAAADDFNISKATIIKCVAGNALVADLYYTLVNVDGGAVGAAWSGLGADAPETDAADLYVRNDTRVANTANRVRDFANAHIEDIAIWSRALSDEEIQQYSGSEVG